MLLRKYGPKLPNYDQYKAKCINKSDSSAVTLEVVKGSSDHCFMICLLPLGLPIAYEVILPEPKEETAEEKDRAKNAIFRDGE